MRRPKPGKYQYRLTSGTNDLAYTLSIVPLRPDELEFRLSREGSDSEPYETFRTEDDGLYRIGRGLRGPLENACNQVPPLLEYTWELTLGQKWSATSQCQERSAKSYRSHVSGMDLNPKEGKRAYVEITTQSATRNSNEACTTVSRIEPSSGLLLDEAQTCHPGPTRTHRWLTSG